MTRTSRRISTIAGTTLAVLLLTSPGRAQDPAPVSARHASQAHELLAAGDIDPAALRQRLKDAGQSDETIDAAMSALGRSGGARAGTPAEASAPRPAEPAPAPAPPAAVHADTVATRLAPEVPPEREPFGYEIFGYAPTTFEPLGYGPVDPDYVVGPGDELMLTLWGDDQLNAHRRRQREGAVTLPEVGQVPVAGLTLAGVRTRVGAALARHYSGLTADGRATTWLRSRSASCARSRCSSSATWCGPVATPLVGLARAQRALRRGRPGARARCATSGSCAAGSR